MLTFTIGAVAVFHLFRGVRPPTHTATENRAARMSRNSSLRFSGTGPLLLAVLSLSCGSTASAIYRVPEFSMTIRVQLQPMHRWLAEYHRTLITDDGSREVSRTLLPDDTGGYLRINVYRLDSNTVVLMDSFGTYAIDLRTGAVAKDAVRRREGAFLGAFDKDQSRTFRFIAAAERAEQRTDGPR